MINAKILADSITLSGDRLVTMELVYPRFIHSEFMTHRALNRNASSSRAIPTQRLIEQVRNEPVMPVHWGKNQKGMQASEELTPMEIKDAEFIWENAASAAAVYAEQLRRGQVHKQIVNRILEPFTHIRVVVTATQWNNFFGLRIHPDAQPEICELATKMKEQYDQSKPRTLLAGEWHLPYITNSDYLDAYDYCKHQRITRDEPSSDEINCLLVKISAARCARASYNNFKGTPSTIEEDLRLFSKLVESKPVHASPTEHQATPQHVMSKGLNEPTDPSTWENGISHMDRNLRLYSGNLCGWIQFRKLLADECIH
ncbi:thymidilate synthase [Escherichia phage VEc25]|uniref:Thymidilate synthase n=1 Tax=Escherichia phage VEc25 TaxID=2794959 RepID=A0A7T1JPQ2_9CAUD|nr:thymidilate synthase [Escherichia phage VEc25]QXV75817.1 thymidylate synthase [Escherichia phage AlfredRasser]